MDEQWTGVAALVDPSRRALYDYVRRAGHAVSREEAADAARMSRNLAAFHLDKLVDAGLLRARYEAAPDRPRGRGRYQLIAEILADAVASDPAEAARAARQQAHRRGKALGAALRTGHHPDLVAALHGLGFEPEPASGRVLLHNCPFHALAARHTSLVCGLNHAFLAGLLDGLDDAATEAHLAPYPGRCCVELRTG